MKLIPTFLFFLLLLSCKQDTPTHLFNGDNLEGWHVDVPDMDTIPSVRNPFIVRDKMLVSLLVNHGYNATVNSGQIALQAEGAEVEFRKVDLIKL